MIGKIETPTTRVTNVTIDKKKKRKKKNTKEIHEPAKEEGIQFGENAAIPTKNHVSTPISTINKW